MHTVDGRAVVKSSLRCLAINFYEARSRVVGRPAAAGNQDPPDFKAGCTDARELEFVTFDIPLLIQSFFTMVVPTFETTFAVPMTCEACIRDIEGSLKHLSGTSDSTKKSMLGHADRT
jgi:hypothetical protein